MMLQDVQREAWYKQINRFVELGIIRRKALFVCTSFRKSLHINKQPRLLWGFLDPLKRCTKIK